MGILRNKTYQETLVLINHQIQETFFNRSSLSGIQCPFCQNSHTSCLEEKNTEDPEQECLCKAMLIHLKRHCLWLGTLIEYQLQEIETKKDI